MYNKQECGRDEYAKVNELEFCDDPRTEERLAKAFSIKEARHDLIKKLHYLGDYSSDPQRPSRATIGAESYSETDFWVRMEVFFYEDGKIWRQIMWQGGLNYHTGGTQWSVNT